MMTKAKQIEQIAEVIYDECGVEWEVCMVIARRVVNGEWRV